MLLFPKATFVSAAFLGLSVGCALAQRADSVVTFNEVHYHPAGAGEPEWVELHNQMAVRVDLSGWRISAGVDYTFLEGSVMEPGANWVVASDPSHSSLAGVADVLGPFTGTLDNGGETLRLRGRHGRVMDEFSYRDGGKWPTAPDGGGATLAKGEPDAASGGAENWSWSEQPGGRGEELWRRAWCRIRALKPRPSWSVPAT
jgi:hypothetical protein